MQPEILARKMNPRQIKNNIPIHSLYWLGGGLVLSALPHSQRIPLWIMPLFLVLCICKLYAITQADVDRKYKFISRVGLSTLMIIGILGIYFNFGTIVGRDAGVALLVMLAGFKICEINQERDFYVACFLGYFVIVTNFLYTQSIGTAVYMACTVLVMTISLVSFNDVQKKLPNKTLGKVAASLLLQSVPIMLILFFLFPRIPGPLWGMPGDAHAGLTGVGDEMSPGSISQLIQSNQVAFRVDFKSEPPEQSQFYWRGPVLRHTDGLSWTRGKSEYQYNNSLEAVSDSPVTYTITLEPHNKKWLYALEMPGSKTSQSRMTSDFQLLTENPVTRRVRYDMTSYPDYKISKLNNDERQASLQLPRQYHSRTKALMRQWLEEGLSENQIIDRALKLFNEDEFYYTLNPPLLENDRVDEFLFDEKQGFCEHYANAFVVMMRAAEIPARIVLGYQGGEHNPVGNYFIIRQRSAHAWTEVWKEKQGWTRVDPTAAVSPLRIIEGIESALPSETLDIPAILGRNSLVKNLWKRLGFRWDAINNQWNQWVISYGSERQKEFLSQFGLGNINWSGMIFLIMAFVGLVLVYLTFTFLRFTPEEKEPAKFLYDQFRKKLSRSGINYPAHEGPVNFAKRASLKRSDLAPQIKIITNMYIAIRYASDESLLDSLRKNIKVFKT